MPAGVQVAAAQAGDHGIARPAHLVDAPLDTRGAGHDRVCLPDANHAAWGGYCNYCEGVRLGFDGERFVGVQVVREGQAGDR